MITLNPRVFGGYIANASVLLINSLFIPTGLVWSSAIFAALIVALSLGFWVYSSWHLYVFKEHIQKKPEQTSGKNSVWYRCVQACKKSWRPYCIALLRFVMLSSITYSLVLAVMQVMALSFVNITWPVDVYNLLSPFASLAGLVLFLALAFEVCYVARPYISNIFEAAKKEDAQKSIEADMQQSRESDIADGFRQPGVLPGVGYRLDSGRGEGAQAASAASVKAKPAAPSSRDHQQDDQLRARSADAAESRRRSQEPLLTAR